MMDKIKALTKKESNVKVYELINILEKCPAGAEVNIVDNDLAILGSFEVSTPFEYGENVVLKLLND